MERAVASILCGMKGSNSLPSQSSSQGSAVLPSQPSVPVSVQQPVQPSTQLPTQMSMQQPIQQLPLSQPSNPPSAPQPTSSENAQPVFTQVPNSVVPSAIPSSSVTSEGIPPIPSPPQTLLPPTMNPMSYASEAGAKEMEKSEEAHDSNISIIPPLDPEQLLSCRMPVACRSATSQPSAPTDIPSVLPAAASGSTTVTEGTQSQQASQPSSLPQSTTEQTSSSQSSVSQHPIQPTPSEGADKSQEKSEVKETDRMASAQGDEEEIVPLVNIATDPNKDETDGVPLTHVDVLKKPIKDEVRQGVPK